MKVTAGDQWTKSGVTSFQISRPWSSANLEDISPPSPIVFWTNVLYESWKQLWYIFWFGLPWISSKHNSSRYSHSSSRDKMQLSFTRVPLEAIFSRFNFFPAVPSCLHRCSSSQLESIETSSNVDSSINENSFARALAPIWESLETCNVVKLSWDSKGSDRASHLTSPNFSFGIILTSGEYEKLVSRLQVVDTI